jgi:hypothetical protein
MFGVGLSHYQHSKEAYSNQETAIELHIPMEIIRPLNIKGTEQLKIWLNDSQIIIEKEKNIIKTGCSNHYIVPFFGKSSV